MIRDYRFILQLMTVSERRKFWMLVGAIFLLSLLEAMSVVSILPFLRLLSEPSLVESNSWIGWIYDIAGFENPYDFLFWMGIAVLSILVSGLGLKMLMIWLATRFALMRSFSLSSRLFSYYLGQPYEWYLGRRSSDIANVVLAEVDKVVSEGLLPAMRLIPDFFSVVLLLVALMLLEPQIAIGGALLLGGTYGIIFLSVRHVLSGIGKIRLGANRSRFHTVQESTGGLKELKVMGLESVFLERFRAAALRMARAQTRGQVIMNVPRQAIEMVAFVGMIGLILFLVRSETGNLSGLLPTLGLLASVGMRLIPAMQQAYVRMSNIRQVRASVERIHIDLLESYKISRPASHQSGLGRIDFNESIDLDDVGYSYPGADRPTLEHIDLRIQANQTVGIVGGTGAGKTTMVDILMGLITPSTGNLRVDGVVISTENIERWRLSVGYVPQTIFLSDSSIAENIAFGRSWDEIDMGAVERAARTAAIHDFIVSEMPEGYKTPVGERGIRLSGGQRQRIGIARALYNDPKVLVFDEATSALDTITESAVIDAIRAISGKKTIIMIAHRLNTVRACDQIVFVKSGQIMATGTYPELIERSEHFRQLAR